MRVNARNKYSARPTTVDGVRFASQAEATRYGELKLLERACEIDRLTLQPAYDLCVTGEQGTIKIGVYRADFEYWDPKAGGGVVEDVKGVRTALYRWKKKHVEAQYGIRIREVTSRGR